MNKIKDLFQESRNAHQKRKYKEALAYLDEVISINPDLKLVWYSKGVVLHDLGRKEDALECYDKAIAIDSDLEQAWNNKGVVLYNLGHKEDALECYDKAIAINPNLEQAWYNKGEVLITMGRFEDAFICFKQGNWGILEIIVRLKEKAEKYIEWSLEHAQDSSEETKFFKETIKLDRKNIDSYKKIYFQALYIISLLYVDNSQEEFIAHYTRKNTSELLISKGDQKFRFNSVTTFNDPQEGKTLLNFLYGDKKNCFNDFVRQEVYRAFAGCFTFNNERLNQFRLYGKEGDKEGTGVSLLFNTDFFSSDIRNITPSTKNDIFSNFHFRATIDATISPSDTIIPPIINDKSTKTKKHQEKKSLFRCIYIDPKTGHVASIGQREEYLFYRIGKEKEETIEEIEKTIDKYNKHIEATLTDVRAGLVKLQKYIENEKKNELNWEIVSKLLISLRHLVKHVAYKEEQECRVIQIEQINNKEVVKVEDNRMYVEYLPVRSYVKKICFGPKAQGIGFYNDRLRHEGLSIECSQCEDPFVG